MHATTRPSNTTTIQPRLQLWLDGRLVAVAPVLKATVGGVLLQGQVPGLQLGDRVQVTVVPGDSFHYCPPWHGVVTVASPAGTGVLVAGGSEQLYGSLQNLVERAHADGS